MTEANKNLPVISIVRDYLESNGFDGLVHTDTECGCSLDDFIPCEECFSQCQPAYKHILKNGDMWMTLDKNFEEEK